MARYQAIVFSGEQADKDVSDEVYIHIKDRNLVNVLYQTVDGDWFAHLDEAKAGINLLANPATQLSLRKFDKEQEDKIKRKVDFFRAEQQEIGRVQTYLLVPGHGVKSGQKEQTTSVLFYYPKKNQRYELEVTVGCAPAPQSRLAGQVRQREKNVADAGRELPAF